MAMVRLAWSAFAWVGRCRWHLLPSLTKVRKLCMPPAPSICFLLHVPASLTAALSGCVCDCECALVDCAVAFYGIPDKALADMASLSKPVLGHFGDKDSMEGFSDPVAADGLEAALTSAGSTHKIHRYPGVGHVRTILDNLPCILLPKFPTVSPTHNEARALGQHPTAQDAGCSVQVLRVYLSVCVRLSRLS